MTPVAVAAGIFVLALLFLLLYGAPIRYIPNDRIGILEKKWALRGSIREGFIALGGEAGFQPDVLRGGYHFFVPFQYRVHRVPLVTITQGQIGYLFARDGQPLPPTQTLASNAVANDFQDVRAFLAAGGQKGPQRKILREGTYALNLAQFIVLTADRTYSVEGIDGDSNVIGRMTELLAERDAFEPIVIDSKLDVIGIVTVHDGPALRAGEIIAPTVSIEADDPHFHNSFQDPEAFLRASGYRGRQHQVLVDGTYYLNGCSRRSRTSPRRSSRSAPSASSSPTSATRATTSPARIIATASSSRPAIAASGTCRCCRASMRSTPTPARSSACRRRTSC